MELTPVSVSCNAYSQDVPTTACNYSCLSMEKPRVTLINEELWSQFQQQGTEMIINNHGRLMFPSLDFKVAGLQPDTIYVCLVEFLPVIQQPLKYIGNQWVQVNQPVLQIPVVSRRYLHPDSPNTGKHWMQSSGVAFSRLKLTNKENIPNQVALKSMHLYQPRFHIIQVCEDNTGIDRTVLTSTFPETRFIAVTSYHNPEITQLKIKFNKFARGFRTKSNAGTSFGEQEGRPAKRRRHFETSGAACPGTEGQTVATVMSMLDDFQPVIDQKTAPKASNTFVDDFLAMLESHP